MVSTVRFYQSTDSGAPSLTGQVGSLIALLDACLVNGYGGQTAAGWTKPFANSGNVGCYQNSVSDGTGFCVSVNDNAFATAKEATATGFNSLTTVSTGTNQFPTNAQLAINGGAVVCRKSATADATVRAWRMAADNTRFHLFIDNGDYPCSSYLGFGDIFSYGGTSDTTRCNISGRSVSNTNTTTDSICMVSGVAGQFTDTVAGLFMAQKWDATGGSLTCGQHINQGLFNASTGNPYIGYLSSNLPVAAYPNPADQGLMLNPIWVAHTSCIRGYQKGLWAPLASRPFTIGDIISGAGMYAGKTFLVQELINSGTPTYSQILVEISNTWS